MMTECEQATKIPVETFLTSLPDDPSQKTQSIVIPTNNDDDDDDDELDIDEKSSADSGDTPLANHEIEEILNKQDPPEDVSLLLPSQPPEALPDKL